MGNKCTVDGCDRKRYGHGWCQLHWKRMKRSGTLDANQQYSTTAERLDGRSQWEGDCLVWTGAKSDGYGTWTDHGKKVYAHRAAWERENGAIPDGKHIDHLCWNRACILPDHLRAVTQAENNQNWQGGASGQYHWNSRRSFPKEDGEVDGDCQEQIRGRIRDRRRG